MPRDAMLYVEDILEEIADHIADTFEGWQQYLNIQTGMIAAMEKAVKDGYNRPDEKMLPPGGPNWQWVMDPGVFILLSPRVSLRMIPI